ncbi:uncharacterized protein SOCE836_069030 [Sorangium cellulosum]|uniref:Uncharacterized protein n=1 Tax=Sorangium cellulosum TaxID=56 RepID=A0A4P2QW71_SORCE|nr:uncharacterized protein SOCE836_069030 [Sorangium cellulosum]
MCWYGARPPFSLERLSILADGRVGHLPRKPRRNGATHLVMTPVPRLASPLLQTRRKCRTLVL